MKQHLFTLALLAALVSGPALRAQDSFRVRVDQPQHGKVTVTPAIPESGVVPAGTVLKVKDSLIIWLSTRSQAETRHRRETRDSSIR